MTVRTMLTDAVLLAVVVVTASCQMSLSERRMRRYRRDCAPIIQWLDSQKTLNEKFPSTLPARYQRILDGFSLPSEYRAHSSGESYEISIGDYSVWRPFVYYYCPHTGWGVDK